MVCGLTHGGLLSTSGRGGCVLQTVPTLCRSLKGECPSKQIISMVTGTEEAAQWMGRLWFKTLKGRGQHVCVLVCLFALQIEQLQALIQVLKHKC